MVHISNIILNFLMKKNRGYGWIWLKLYILGISYMYIIMIKEGRTMEKGYIRVTGNSNIAFNYPLRALVITTDDYEPDYEPDISTDLTEEISFNNWMYIRKKKGEWSGIRDYYL